MLKRLTIDEFRAAAREKRALEGTVSRLALSDGQAVDGQARTIRFVFSDGTVDRAGDRIDPEGWDTEDFLKNPVALWAHDSYSPPIGRASNIGPVAGKLMGDIEFMPADISAFADSVFRMVQGGYVKAVSVGFRPIEWTFTNDKDRPYGIDFTKQELLEISVCPVPCNPNALLEARAKGINTAPLLEWAERLLDTGESVLVPRALLEETFKAAKTPKTTRQKYLAPRAKTADWKVGAARDLPLDQSDSWDGAAAAASIFEHAGGDDFNPEVARKGFLVYDASAPKLRGSYKEPFAHVVDGTLKAVKGGIRAAASRLPQADISDGARAEAKGVIEHYEKAFGIGEGDKSVSGEDVPTGTCGRSKDEECLMKDPQNCAVHYVPPAPPKSKAGRRISAATKALLEAAASHHAEGMACHAKALDCIKTVLESNDPAGDGDDDANQPTDDEDTKRHRRQEAARKLREELGIEN